MACGFAGLCLPWPGCGSETHPWVPPPALGWGSGAARALPPRTGGGSAHDYPQPARLALTVRALRGYKADAPGDLQGSTAGKTSRSRLVSVRGLGRSREMLEPLKHEPGIAHLLSPQDEELVPLSWRLPAFTRGGVRQASARCCSTQPISRSDRLLQSRQDKSWWWCPHFTDMETGTNSGRNLPKLGQRWE
nr:uncharacterized protein LOC101941985 isoform X2 [Chrysemys picta bellii]